MRKKHQPGCPCCSTCDLLPSQVIVHPLDMPAQGIGCQPPDPEFPAWGDCSLLNIPFILDKIGQDTIAPNGACQQNGLQVSCFFMYHSPIIGYCRQIPGTSAVLELYLYKNVGENWFAYLQFTQLPLDGNETRWVRDTGTTDGQAIDVTLVPGDVCDDEGLFAACQPSLGNVRIQVIPDP